MHIKNKLNNFFIKIIVNIYFFIKFDLYCRINLFTGINNNKLVKCLV